MARIGSGSIYTETWRTIFSITKNAFTLGSTYSSFPEPIAGKPLSFPLAVLDNSEASIEKNTFTTGGLRDSDITVPVTVYTRSRADVDLGTDQIQNGLRASGALLMASGLHSLMVTQGGGGTDVIGDRDKIHFKTLLVGVKHTA